jgi:hypothetical protein
MHAGPSRGQRSPGVTAMVCDNSDVSCSHPSATGVTDSDGTVSLVQQVDAGPVYVNGYIDLSGGGGVGIVPELLFWSFPLGQSPASLSATTVTPFELAAFLAAVTVTQDVGNGYVYAVGFDCLQFRGMGLTFAITPAGSSQILYQQGSTFSPGLSATDDTGGALFVNAPAGGSVLTATVAAAGGPIGQFPLFVRDGGVTEVWALPQPN